MATNSHIHATGLNWLIPTRHICFLMPGQQCEFSDMHNNTFDGDTSRRVGAATLADRSRLPFLKAVTTSVLGLRLYSDRTFLEYDTGIHDRKRLILPSIISSQYFTEETEATQQLEKQIIRSIIGKMCSQVKYFHLPTAIHTDNGIIT